MVDLSGHHFCGVLENPNAIWFDAGNPLEAVFGRPACGLWENMGTMMDKVVPQFVNAKLVQISPIKPMVYGRYNELVFMGWIYTHL